MSRGLASASLLAMAAASCTFPDFVVDRFGDRGGSDSAGGGGMPSSGGNGGSSGSTGATTAGGGAGAMPACAGSGACAGAPTLAGSGGEAGAPLLDIGEIPGLVLRYGFDDASAPLVDSSGHHYDAAVGDFDWVTGQRGNALSLDGYSGYLNLPAGITDQLSDFTITLWVKPKALDTWARLFDIGTGQAAFLALVGAAPGTLKPRFSFKLAGSNTLFVESSVALTLDTWQLVSVTQSGNTVTLYIDGALVGQDSIFTYRASAFSADHNYLGKSQYGDPKFDGAFDEFRLYNRALSGGEISDVASGAAVSNGLVLGYDFDETTGPIAADLGKDASKTAGVQTGVALDTGVSGSALVLDGSSGYVRLPPNVLTGLGDFTIACFVKQLAVRASARLFDFGSDSANYMTLMPSASSQRLRFGSNFDGGSEQVLDTVPLALGTWEHVAVTRTGASIRVYVHGAEVGSRVVPGLPADLTTASNWLGRSHRGDPILNAAIDDFRIYDHALDATELAALAAQL